MPNGVTLIKYKQWTEGHAQSVYGPLAFSLQNFHYFLEGALEVCPYLHVPRVKREPKYTLILK